MGADLPGHLTETHKTENNTVWAGKVKRLELSGCAVDMLPKLRLHDENTVEELVPRTGYLEHLTETLKTESKSIWVGKVRVLKLEGIVLRAFPKLRLHGENVMEVLELNTDRPEDFAEILKEENNSIWVGRVNRLRLEDNAVGILPKLIIREENVMEWIELLTGSYEEISDILRTENNSLWIGKVRRLFLFYHAVGILPKLRFHEENVFEEFVLNVYDPKGITEILKTENKSIWIGKVRKIEFKGCAEEIKNKLDFTLITPDD
ncbi:MAG: uncharacterized protein A8A55_2426 [Amphiamblys sp. WSBS2006]|nr:MAG: uncharacterized protein A8A55_2426 [Amphiamblys sp. WSBS2006]